ncbi:MAG: SET domain-containing protein [Saprospiraceae bacterium]
MQRHPALYFADSPIAGRGIFCADTIESGELLEICPVIVLSSSDRMSIHSTRLHDFYFSWDANEQKAAIALGFGSLFNHSANPNVGYDMDFDNQLIHFYSLRLIEAGEELLIDYMQGEREGLWF